MKILVANDDGIKAEGIARLVEALSSIADVYVAAPHTQRSATGHGITVGKPITIKEVDFEHAVKGLEISGTPADCVKLGLRYLEQQKIEIDMVFAGINHGGNLGTDTLYSGTVSAALEGALCGKPAVAVSVNSHEPEHFTYACELAISAAQKMRTNGDGVLTLNINVPNLPKEKIKGVKYTRLGVREYEEWFNPKENEQGEKEYWYHGSPVIYRSKDTRIDVIADQEDYASITPLKCDLTNKGLIKEIEQWRIENEEL